LKRGEEQRPHYNRGADGSHRAETATVLKFMKELTTTNQVSVVAIDAVAYACQHHSKCLYALHIPKHKR
jgi:hypothetical protein